MAKGDWRAIKARELINDAGIQVDDPRNKVTINKKYHRVVHSDTYNKSIEAALFNASKTGGKNGVINELRNIKTKLWEAFKW